MNDVNVNVVNNNRNGGVAIIKVILLIIIVCFSFGIGFIVKQLMIESDDKCISDVPEKSLNVDYRNLYKAIDELGALEYVDRNINNDSYFTNQEMLVFVLNHMDGTWTLDNVQKYANKYFGRDIKPENVHCLARVVSEGAEDEVVYDSSNKVFKTNENHPGHGVGNGVDVLNRVMSVNVENDMYTVEVKKAFAIVPEIGPILEYYATLSDAKSENSPLFINESDNDYDLMNWDVDYEFSKISDDKLVTYTYVFEKVDDNYILASYTF